MTHAQGDPWGMLNAFEGRLERRNKLFPDSGKPNPWVGKPAVDVSRLSSELLRICDSIFTNSDVFTDRQENTGGYIGQAVSSEMADGLSSFQKVKFLSTFKFIKRDLINFLSMIHTALLLHRP